MAEGGHQWHTSHCSSQHSQKASPDELVHSSFVTKCWLGSAIGWWPQFPAETQHGSTWMKLTIALVNMISRILHLSSAPQSKRGLKPGATRRACDDYLGQKVTAHLTVFWPLIGVSLSKRSLDKDVCVRHHGGHIH